jgi:hypothetical protein
MRQLLTVSFGLILIVAFSCKVEKKTDDDLDPKALHNVFVKMETNIENIFEIVEIIPLEIPYGNALVEIYRFQYHDNNYFLLDRDFGTLLRFSAEGKALVKIGDLGDAPEEVVDIADFTLNSTDNELALLSIEQRSISFFDLNGNFKRKIRLRNQSDMISIDQDQNIGMSITYFNEDFSNFELINNAGSSIKTLFPFPKNVFPISLKSISGHITNSDQGGILYQEPANSVIFEIGKFESFPKFQFDSDEPMWPKEKKHQLNEFFQTLAKGELAFPTRFFEESKTHLFFTWNKKKRATAERLIDYRTGVYDKSTKQTYIAKENKLSQMMSGPLGVEGDLVFFSIPLYQLLELVDEPILKNHLSQISELKKEKGDVDVPVIIKMRTRL